jgi:acyl-CoA thioester hydrolase
MLTGYPYVIQVPVRWRDIDAFRHVNNATIVTYLEIARAEMWHEVFKGSDAMDIPFVIAKLEVDYRRPIRLYDDVRVGLRAADIGRSSFAFEYLIEVEGHAAVVARTLQVCIRHETGRPIRVPEEVRRTLATLVEPSP